MIKYFPEVYKDHKISATNQTGKILESPTKKYSPFACDVKQS